MYNILMLLLVVAGGTVSAYQLATFSGDFIFNLLVLLVSCFGIKMIVREMLSGNKKSYK
jgi:hypothetical protein